MPPQNPLAVPDPFSFADPFSRQTRTVDPNAPLPPLTEEERSSLLARVGSGALHGLGWLGSSLGKAFGGRAIRGLLGGKPHELLSAIPLSDTFHWTNPEDEVHGSTLLGGDKDTGFFTPQGLGGFALDVATDPLTYLSFGGGALTKLGKTAEKVGILPKNIGGAGGRIAGFGLGSAEADALATAHTMLSGKLITPAEVAGQSLGGHAGWHIPFTEAGGVLDLTKPIAAAGAVADFIPGVRPTLNYLDKATAPIRRGWGALFDKDSKGFWDEIFQPEAIANSGKAAGASNVALKEATPIMELAQDIVGKRAIGAPHKFGDLWTPAHDVASKGLGQELVMYMEMKPMIGTGKLTTAQEAAYHVVASDPQVVKLGDMMIGQYGAELSASQAAGYADKALQDMGYTFRQATQKPASEGGLGKLWGELSPSEQEQRLAMFKGMLTEGPGGLNELSRDKTLLGLPVDVAEKAIRDKYLGITAADEATRAALKSKAVASITPAEEGLFTELLNKQRLGTITPAEQLKMADLLTKKSSSILDAEKEALKLLDSRWKQAEDLVGWHKKLDHDALDKAGGFFGHHPLAMFEEYKLGQASRRMNADSTFNVLPKIVEATPSVGSKSLASVMEQAGMPIDVIGSAAHAKMMKALGLTYANDFEKLTISKENTNLLLGFLNPAQMQAPAGAKPFLALYDSLTNLIKAGQTSWPATQFRNVMSDIFKRWSGGGEAFAPLMQAKTLREGGTVADLAKSVPRFSGMTDAEATQQLWREMYQLGLLKKDTYQAIEAVGVPGLETFHKSQPVIGARPIGLGEAVSETIPGLGNKWGMKVRGVGGAEESTLPGVATMQSAQNYFEEMNRIATYIDSVKRGYDPLAAMAKVIEAHHDFSALSGFEKSVMRRIIPFYSWLKQSVPQVVGEIATNPGGRMAQTMRLMHDAQQGGGFVPEDVAKSGYHIPIGGLSAEGKQRFLTSTGLPMEDLSNLFSLQTALGSTTPFIRVPFEMATGRSVYGANELPMNYPLPVGATGGTTSQFLNSAFQASPFARTLSSATVGYQGVTDPANQGLASLMRLTLGTRTANVQQDQARRQAAEQYAQSQLAGNPLIRNFQNLYARPQDRAALTPQELMLLRFYQDAQQNRLAPR